MWYEGWRNDVCSKARGVVDVVKVCGFVEVHRKEREHMEFLLFSRRRIVDRFSVVARVIVGT